MASGTIVGEGGVNNNDGAATREKQRYSESKVYTRKAFKGPKNNINNINTTTTTTTVNPAPPTTTATLNPAPPTTTATLNPAPPTTTASAASPTITTTANAASITTTTATATAALTTTTATANNATVDLSITNTTITTTETASAANCDDNRDNEKNKINKDERNNKSNSIQVPESQTPALEDTNSAQQQPVSRLEANSDDSSSLNRQQGAAEVAPSGRDATAENGVVKQGLNDKVKINLASKSKQEMKELRRKLESELDMVRSLVKKIEAKEVQLGVSELSNLQVSLNDRVYNGLKRVNSEVVSVGLSHDITTPIATPTPRQSRPLNQLSISVFENSQGAVENVEKEKRTPKANQFYRNSEFLLAKDKFPPAESNKKSKLNGKKQGGGDMGFGFGAASKIFKNCSALLEKLMKHKYGWVFKSPVDVKGLGLHDYFTIIKHPMDLGTVKTRLNKNWYKSPEEFAEDVRLTFHNAMRYNPKGQDVHVMAEILLKLFEDRWVVIKSEFDREMRFVVGCGIGIPTPTSRKAPLPPPPLDMRRILDRSDSMRYQPIDPRSKPISTTPSGRTPAPKKPKAKDPHKRDMTYDEKQKLSTNLQSLPSEKLDNIVQIIKKRNSSLSQHDDEIEVDIDSVDAETLWELDRFVTNYKKSLSKNKRKAELASQARAEAERNVQEKSLQTPAAVVAPPQGTKTDERNVSTSSPVQVENQGDNGTRSSSSSSSSSDSGSSSDSDSDSSSTSESDVGP
ncbi:transcription factor GTE4 isoform X2 [Ricinus communis]|uniref:Bromodomain-containing protein, putative n=1 Tax=Ricinus communis TaxID=3988 RepID=B9SGL2_RICCO|nr:transcription factor GTE4 isoform X2 [Ricinus communis]EEF37258.1 bromodomain-containing protein, putative [Ricinus communis]|eukprot:XP_002525131.1 transcription factor GTE4 [Ricinus communis]